MMKNQIYSPGDMPQLAKVNNINITIGIAKIVPVTLVRNLGYFTDCHLKNGSHINKICGQLFGTLKTIQKLRCHLDEDTAKTVVQAFILSNFDYCSSAVIGSSWYQLNKLQRVQNMACRVVANLGKYDHVSSDMK